MTARIVIIGGGQAGGWAAKTLRDEGFSGEICVVAEEQWDFYERPPLSKAALLEAARCVRIRSIGKIKPWR